MTLNHDVSAICGKLAKAQREVIIKYVRPGHLRDSVAAGKVGDDHS